MSIRCLAVCAVLATLPLAASKSDAGAAAERADQAALRLPENDAGRCVRDFFEMLRDPTPERIRAFEAQHRSAKRLNETGMEERIARVKDIGEQMGKLELTEVLSVAGGAISVRAGRERGGETELEFIFDAQQGGKLDGIRISRKAAAGEAVKSAALTAESRRELVDAVAGAVAEGYVYPELGERMAQAVRGHLKAGRYDEITEDGALARRLTDDLREISKDRHLGVRLEPRREARHDGPGVEDIAGENHAFRKAEVLAGNIGYVRLDAFVPGEAAYKTASAAMAFVAHCDALIFDLRYNGGGSPESIRFITSYLFEKPTHLNDMIDRDGKVVEEFWTLEAVPGDRFATDLPVFVLTSGRTFSGAEEFSYNLQNLKRATIVGETTGGGAHPVRGVRVNDRVVVGVPFMRACNPVSKKNWEGTGVQPDVKVTSEEALDRAVELAKKAVAGRRAGAQK